MSTIIQFKKKANAIQLKRDPAKNRKKKKSITICHTFMSFWYKIISCFELKSNCYLFSLVYSLYLPYPIVRMFEDTLPIYKEYLQFSPSI